MKIDTLEVSISDVRLVLDSLSLLSGHDMSRDLIRVMALWESGIKSAQE